MKIIIVLCLLLGIVLSLQLMDAAPPKKDLEKIGISLQEARFRAEIVSNVTYDITFALMQTKIYFGHAIIKF
jgi:hypothetical protein